MLVKFNSDDVTVLDGMPYTGYFKDKVCQCKGRQPTKPADFSLLRTCLTCGKFSRYYFGQCENCRGVHCTLFYHPNKPIAGLWCWYCCDDGIKSIYGNHEKIFPNRKSEPLPDYLLPPREEAADFDSIFDSILEGIKDIL